jgi:hypothetical protein
MAIEAKPRQFDCRRIHQPGRSPGSRFKWVNDIGAEGLSRKRQCRPNRLFVEPGVRVKYLSNRSLKSGELAAKIDKLQFTLCESCANGRQLLALTENFLFFWFQPPGDRT